MKKILITLAAVIMAAGLAACSDSPSQQGGASGQSSGQSTAQTGTQDAPAASGTASETPAQAESGTASETPAQASGQAESGTASETPVQAAGEASGETADKTTVSLGVTNDAQTIFTPGIDWIKENKGITVTMTLIENDGDMLRAVRDGGVDAGLGVDIRAMEEFNQENDASLVMLTPYPFASGVGLYSDTFTSLEEFPEGAKIAIMNDPIYMDRGLRMLRDSGFIVLDPAKDSGFSVSDITENPKKIEFIVVDQAQTAESPQEIDGAVISFEGAKNAGRDPGAFIVRDKDAERYPTGVIVKAGNEESAWAKALADTMLSEPVRAGVAEHFAAVYRYFE